MRLLIDRHLASAYLTGAVDLGLEPDSGAEVTARLTAREVGEHDAAFLPSAEIARLSDTHVVIPDLAVVFPSAGPVAMRVPVRPDEITASPVYLHEANSTAEILVRATLEPFYGIPATRWTTEPDADVRVVVVDSFNALLSPEAGLSEDLCRAWFILTGEPVVSHVLVGPKSASIAELEEIRAHAKQLLAVGLEHRREIRKTIVEHEGVDLERLRDLQTNARYSLTTADRRALLMLLQRGNKGSVFPYLWEIAYFDASDDTA